MFSIPTIAHSEKNKTYFQHQIPLKLNYPSHQDYIKMSVMWSEVYALVFLCISCLSQYMKWINHVMSHGKPWAFDYCTPNWLSHTQHVPVSVFQVRPFLNLGKREQQISWVELLESLSVQIVERGLLAVAAVYCTLHCVLHGITLGSFPNRSHSHDPHPCPHPRNVEYDSSPFLCVHQCGIDPDCVTSEGPSRSDTFPARRGLSPDFPCMSSLQSLWV